MEPQVNASLRGKYALPCPECRMRGIGGAARVGNRRTECLTCNQFATTVGRISRQQLKERHVEEYEEIRAVVERELYPQIIEDFPLDRRPEMVANPEWEGLRDGIPPEPEPLGDELEPVEVSWDPTPSQGTRGRAGLR